MLFPHRQLLQFPRGITPAMLFIRPENYEHNNDKAHHVGYKDYSGAVAPILILFGSVPYGYSSEPYGY